ncbi:MAG: acyltransferase [Rikenellaceae bacterium]|nr:acyltransferase [Rikenellaceae bacterium]
MESWKRVFGIDSEEQFEREALAMFRRQAVDCAPYAEYLALMGCNPKRVTCIEEIPFLPIRLFKHREIYCGAEKPEVVFTSSATTGMTPSRHPMASLALYEEAFTEAFRRFYGEPAQWSLYALLPNYLQREGSSLVYMADRLIRACGSGGFYLDQHEQLIADMASDPKPKILLGVSYALWDLVERHAPKLTSTIVMETGGMKGHREELPKEAFHRILCEGFGVEAIHSEYGMAELTSQAYSKGQNRFYCPPWMRVLVRDVNDPMAISDAKGRGGLNIIDLANYYSCAFLQTEDVGIRHSDGSFEIEGRIDHSEIRGCNLLVQ